MVNSPEGTGYAAHREDMVLAGKTGTAEIKDSKEDTEGTELGWFAVLTPDKNSERPVLIVSMVEDVKGRGGKRLCGGEKQQGAGTLVWKVERLVWERAGRSRNARMENRRLS